ncbi:MAG: prepilin-type N-terminal cleavage/methylation domain-containing protein [Cyanobacterium sp. T60_A2020_053]|nr:prepilin-type N-terminal cleavage/methylation domain-containing protein [Cyanobacterium sp. T60_A2020_053]
MKKSTPYKLIFALNRSSQGFTLVELLVVIIILGILSAIALPNFLKQVGKARDVEFRNAVGTINRGQQAFHWERQVFADGTTFQETFRALNVTINSGYIDDYVFETTDTNATIQLVNNNFKADGTKAYAGGTFFQDGDYFTIACQSLDVESQIAAPLTATDCGVNERLK